MNGPPLQQRAYSQLQVGSKFVNYMEEKSFVCIYIAWCLRISGAVGLHTFKRSFVNIIYHVSSLLGSACIIRRRTRFVPSFDFYLFIPSQRAAIDALLIVFLSSKYPPIDCTNISLREESKTASQLQISFVTFLEAGGEPCSGQHISWESLFICTIQEDEMGSGCLGLVGFVLMDAFLFGNYAIRESGS